MDTKAIDEKEELRLEEAGVRNGSVVLLTRPVALTSPKFCNVRKPIIYLFPPVQDGVEEDEGVSVNVGVELKEGWKFDSIYPPPLTLSSSSDAPTPSSREKEEEYVEWRVRARSNGNLVMEYGDQLEASYLFWEAK